MTHWKRDLAVGIALAISRAVLAADAPVPANSSGGGAAPLPLLPPPPPIRDPVLDMTPDDMQQRFSRARVERDQAIQVFVDSNPEVFQGPAQSGVYAVALLMRADGSVIRTRKVLLPDEQLTGGPLFHWQPFQIVNGTSSSQQTWVRGTPLAPDKTLCIDVALSWAYVPADFDEARSALRVEEAVLAKHADLLRPEPMSLADGGYLNWLVVFMNEDGTIARDHVEELQLSDVVAQQDKVGPRSFDRLADVFRMLDLEPDQLGVMGQTSVSALPDGTPGSTPTLFASPQVTLVDGAPRTSGGSAMRNLLESRSLIVSYAWPRRPDEPPGGAFGAGMASRQAYKDPIDPGIALAIVERYFPDEFVPVGEIAGNRPWILLSQHGEVLRTGITSQETFTVVGPAGRTTTGTSSSNDFLQTELPGVKLLGGTYGISVRNKSDQQVGVTFMWLDPESPLPPAK